MQVSGLAAERANRAWHAEYWPKLPRTQTSGDSLGEAIKNATLHKPISPKRSNYPVSVCGYINSTYKVGAEGVYLFPHN